MSKYINPPSKSNLFLFQDLGNPRLTWRLYSQTNNPEENEGPILSGFYSLEGSFAIGHTWASGFGDAIYTALVSNVLDAKRSVYRKSRDLSNASRWIRRKIKRDDEEFTDIDDTLARGIVHTPGDTSKLFGDTNISIPDISNLTTQIWSTKDEPCTQVIENLKKYFLGEFRRVSDKNESRGGYWVAPNKIDLRQDDPTTDSNVRGAFTLYLGPYILKNLLPTGIKWEYSRLFGAYPDSDGEIPKVQSFPAFVDITVSFENYKYKTDAYLNSTWAPTFITEEELSSKYNK